MKTRTNKPNSYMNYSIMASSSSQKNGSISIKGSQIPFGTTMQSAKELANPAELFLGAFSACILKNVERFSTILNFEYSRAEVKVMASRLEKPPRMDKIDYTLTIYSQDDKLKPELLRKNIEKYGTIFNTVKLSSTITGEIKKVSDETTI